MKPIRRRLLTVWIACLGWAYGASLLVLGGAYAALDAGERAALIAMIERLAPLPGMLLVGVAILAGFLAARIVSGYFEPLARVAEAVSILSTANSNHHIDAGGPRELQAVAAGVNALGERYREATSRTQALIAQASRALETEKNRLAVLMSELAQGVVACDPQATIMLYNEQARRLFAAVPDAYLGLGRSLYGLLERSTLEGAMQRLEQRSQAGDIDPIEVLTVTLAAGRIARVRVSPMAGRNEAGIPIASGYVVLLEDVTDEVTGVEARNRILSELTAEVRSALAMVRPALARLSGNGALPAPASQALLAAATACNRLSEASAAAEAAHAAVDRDRSRDPDAVRASDLLDIVAAAPPGQGWTVDSPSVPSALFVRLHVQELLQTLRYLTVRLRDDFRIRDVSIGMTLEGDRIVFDLGWLGHRLSGTTLAAWEDDPLAVGGEASPITLREMLERQGAELAHEIDRVTGQSRLRLSLPVDVRPVPVATGARSARPLFYDFDLPALAVASAAWATYPLGALSYTAFDTETTGLDPSGGDEIISIGAMRIVNGRLLDAETFDQLVDPRRPIHPEAVKVHGIRGEMLRGQPGIERVLPRFHRFCADTVLVGHNVAFDLRFFQMKEQVLGVQFRQPVLDTLLLAAVVHEHTGDHRLEAIAHRLGIEVVARHTALGDARVTAEVFLKMLPLLAARGIRTLGEAQAASENTAYAKLRY